MNELPIENAEMPYNPDGDDTEESRLIDKFEQRLLAINGVVGVGFGRDDTGEDAIIVYLRDLSVVENLPEELDGYPIVPEVTGEIDAY